MIRTRGVENLKDLGQIEYSGPLYTGLAVKFNKPLRKDQLAKIHEVIVRLWKTELIEDVELKRSKDEK